MVKDDAGPLMEDFVFLQGDSAVALLSDIREIAADADGMEYSFHY